jgi:hypothetical protein
VGVLRDSDWLCRRFFLWPMPIRQHSNFLRVWSVSRINPSTLIREVTEALAARETLRPLGRLGKALHKVLNLLGTDLRKETSRLRLLLLWVIKGGGLGLRPLRGLRSLVSLVRYFRIGRCLIGCYSR